MNTNALMFALSGMATLLCYREYRFRRLLRNAHLLSGLHLKGERFLSIVENAIEGIFQSTPEGSYIHVNPALAHLYGYKNAQDLIDNLHNIAKDLYVDPKRRGEFQHLLQMQDFVRDFESEVYKKDGSIIWITENARAVRDENGDLLYYEGSVLDITQRKSAEYLLSYQALHDSLTGLPNRYHLQNRLQQAIPHAEQDNLGLAVLFVDLDDFKVINDSMGHEAGDTLLKTLSDRLSKALRKEDTIARIGGDEFVILLERLTSVDEAIQVAERIVSELKSPIFLLDRDVFTSATIGIAYSDHGQHLPGSLLRDADAAMYHAKTHHKSSYVLFAPEMNAQVVDRLEIETGLRLAIESNELRIHYQPLIELHTNRMSGVEALLRWQHPTRGLLYPGAFIEIAEDSGQIVPIGYWVLEEACRQMQEWRTLFPNCPLDTINVNLSGKQLQRPDIVERVAEILKKTHLPPQSLKLEITESVVMKNLDATLTKLNGLKALGVKLAMDDFGTGYSSIASLSRLPLDTVKIDRAFVNRLTEHEDAHSVLVAIITLSSALKLNVTGEGIETAHQKSSLQNLGCHVGQGYLFAKPLPPEMLCEHPYFHAKEGGESSIQKPLAA